MKVSGRIPLAARAVEHLIDPAVYPAGAIITLRTEISEDGGRTWIYHGGATIERDQVPAGRLAGTGVAFVGESGNANPDYMIRTTAHIGGAPIDISGAAERRDGVLNNG